ncbi:3-methyladenine DNA glycosylase [Candidatus Peregrinibacteria bacterium RIFOXYB12_FULL_41_12]|nr:MAG: 3-methyladenine DNA glycosylase [Candidatus Peregrinibacteria bacterium RIFOXYA2_FULL_41_18]OGJ49288.1 MAG: 3-methyladenine DNA glycosylase [Candidatus Peregrinibacteria bacterium RIFOXYB12_FULL_41_12]OGJ52527.1 MAG: 3-methyladenine DNA glycosylase [Candidatus Peregrinibacteria bacterium RIFOXYB2_FULL_41_88]
MRLSRDFFERNTLDVARELLGKFMVFNGKVGRITEVEAYIGQDDPACHAARGMTPRNRVMFGQGGFSYVYFIYGMYHCLNFVTEREGFPAAVLIRGVESVSGPGRLCKTFGIDKTHSGVDLCTSDSFYVEDRGYKPACIKETPRIGIKVGKDKMWRFIDDAI